jgi:hypothetical protein
MDRDQKAKDNDYPRAFICAFCKQEFASMGSVFSHMSDMHGFARKST